MKKNKLVKELKKILFIFCFWPLLVSAQDQESVGDFAQNILTGAMDVKSIFRNICIIIGSFLILNSFFQYRKHRRNPSEMPIGRPITTFIVGIVVIAITFIPLQNIN